MIFLVISLFLTACEKDTLDNTPPPTAVNNLTYIPTNGGAIISYNLPEDSSILFVKAVYVNSQNNEVFKVASTYNRKIEIDGFNDESTHKVKLYSVGKNKKESEPVEIDIIPLKSFIYLVRDDIKIKEIFGGVSLTWKNISEKTVFVYVDYYDGLETKQRIFSSSRLDEIIQMRGLENKEYQISVTVEDFNGNKSEKIDAGKFTPFLEQKINKSTWKLLQNLSCNGDAYEGRLVNFFDDVIDVNTNPNDNSYFIIHRDNNGGVLNYPMNIIIDMNKSVVVNRFVYWQRAYWWTANDGGANSSYYFYNNDNMRSFEVFGSNNLTTWFSLKYCDLGNPKDAEGNIPSAKIKEALEGHEFVLTTPSSKFRYLKIAVLSSFGSETLLCGSEITLYGLDNQ